MNAPPSRPGGNYPPRKSALVALIVAYRRQKISEADSVHDRTRVLNERFTAIAAQLGDEQPAVRLAGVHAMAGLADDWKQNRQTCVDVLCAYLRLPYDPDPGDADPTKRTAYRANREVRHTIIRLIGAHLQPGAARSWQGLNLDFTGVVFDGGNFGAARFSSGTVLFDGAQFYEGTVSFSGARFSGSKVSFSGAEFLGGEVHFTAAEFSGSTVDFNGAKFLGGEVYFGGAEFSGGQVYFRHAEFSGGKVSFPIVRFSGGEVSFGSAKFSGSTVSFGSAKFPGGGVYFDGAEFSGGGAGFEGAEFSGGQVSFNHAKFSSAKVSFSGAGFLGGTVGFNGAEFSGGQVRFNNANFTGGEVNFRHAEFSGGEVNFSGARFSALRVHSELHTSGPGFATVEFSGSELDFSGARFVGCAVNFADVEGWSHPPGLGWEGRPPPGVVLPGPSVRGEGLSVWDYRARRGREDGPLADRRGSACGTPRDDDRRQRKRQRENRTGLSGAPAAALRLSAEARRVGVRYAQ